MMRIETERLILRPLEARDGEAWIAMISDPEVRRYLPPGPVPTLHDFPTLIEKRQRMERERGYAIWAVEEKSSGELVGQCGLFPAEGKGPEVEIAYHFDKASWGKGYATEAASAVLVRGLGPIGLKRIIGIVMPENIASCRVLEKAGLRFEGFATYYGIDGLKKYVADQD
jgi:[ribosomal protein S5]-alanine N-acetyltransferase